MLLVIAVWFGFFGFSYCWGIEQLLFKKKYKYLCNIITIWTDQLHELLTFITKCAITLNFFSVKSSYALSRYNVKLLQRGLAVLLLQDGFVP